MEDHSLGCVVMAAGDGRRFGGNKLAVELDGRTLIRRTLEAVPQESFQRVVVVTQYPEVESLAESFGFSPIQNLHPDWGISLTISLGLTSLSQCDGVCFLVADQPFLRRESVAELVRLWRGQPERIVALGHGDVRGNPCIFPAWTYPQLLALKGDHGGSAVIRRHEEALTLLEVSSRELMDVDTAAALAELQTGDHRDGE